jgi:hypothetical protein
MQGCDGQDLGRRTFRRPVGIGCKGVQQIGQFDGQLGPLAHLQGARLVDGSRIASQTTELAQEPIEALGQQFLPKGCIKARPCQIDIGDRLILAHVFDGAHRPMQYHIVVVFLLPLP